MMDLYVLNVFIYVFWCVLLRARARSNFRYEPINRVRPPIHTLPSQLDQSPP